MPHVPPHPTPPPLPLGRRLPAGPFADATPDVFYDAPELAVHRGRPWLHAHLKARHGLALAPPGARASAGTLSVPVALLDYHTLVIGATGSGKTRLSLHLLTERLRAGGSALVLDFKPDTVRQALVCAERAGLSPGQVTLLWPGEAGRGVPGWNPFAGEPDELRQRVRQFVGLVRASADVAGTRMWDLLTNAATVVAGQSLSMVELLRFLQSPDYMAGLLAAARHTPAWEEFEEAHLYFALEFAALSKAERGSYVGPVLNKVRALVDIPYLKALMGADRDTLDLPGLWRRQRLIVVHLDEYALGPDGARLLAGMLAHTLFSTAMRQAGDMLGRVGVTLMLDELASQERYLGETVKHLVEKGRQQGLHLLAAGQHLEQIGDELRKLLLSSCALRVFFRLGPDDAARAGRWLATGAGSRPLRLALSVDSGGVQEEWRQSLRDPWDREISLEKEGWQTFRAVQQSCRHETKEEHRRLPALRLLLEAQGMGRLYVRSPETGEPCELGAFVRGLPANAFLIAGPSPLQMVVRFPRPKVTVLATRGEAEQAGLIAQALMQLGRQEAVVVTDAGEKALVRAVDTDFPTRLPDVQQYLSRQEQTEEEMRHTQQRRRSGIQALSGAAPAAGANAAVTPDIATLPSGVSRPPQKRRASRTPVSRLVAAGQPEIQAAPPQPPAPRVTRPEVEDDGTI